MTQTYADYLSESSDIIRRTATSLDEATFNKAVKVCVDAVNANKIVLTCGNGGSASDASHIAGELIVRFEKNRRAFRCACLSDNSATLTACANDFDYASVFERQVESLGEKGGVLIALSTSGNSPNVLKAAQKAKEMGMSVISFTGEGGGKLAALSDVLLAAPAKRTAYIQQVHLCLYHFLCVQIELLANG